MAGGFELHPQLRVDSFDLGQLNLSRLLLINDANYPWFVLVPQREGIREIFQLSDADQATLLAESSRLSQVLMAVFSGYKLNVAALGNSVPQLHIHHIVRYQNDPAWPAPVWGKLPALAYKSTERDKRINLLRAALNGYLYD
ncbi:HIT domain-containing protein [Aliidiomarina quisquiliarum]|uniref:HIT domain-containing protein n=1 Tax=Aliidiomarina quisquiliarum TaxID=2938947 RepID=UPI00208F1BEA|nr:HIT domain-containing protein [Aliidiomarina quisquiliarum]MCO4321602.1 HIT domain-containing protein [Aliidiomarina quisquiliarum]